MAKKDKKDKTAAAAAEEQAAAADAGADDASEGSGAGAAVEHTDGGDGDSAAVAAAAKPAKPAPACCRTWFSHEFSDMLWYMLFLFMFAAVIFGPRNADPFFLKESLDQMYIGNDYDKGINFMDTASLTQAWQWLDQIMLPNLYPDEMYNGQRRSEDLRRTATDLATYRIGLVRLRNVRAKQGTCARTNLFAKSSILDAACYAPYSCSSGPFGSSSTEGTEDWVNPAPNSEWSEGWLPPTLKYRTAAETGEDSFYSYATRTTYCAGGQFVDLPDSYTNATAVARALWNSTWIDRSTRALIVEANLYNANTDQFAVLRMALEMHGAGMIVPAYTVHVVPLLRPLRAMSADGVPKSTYFLLLVEFTLYGFVIFYMAREFALARRMHKRDPPEGYLRSGWNLLEVTNLTCFATVAFLRLGCLGVVGVLAKSGQFEKKGRFIGELTRAASAAKMVDYLNSFNAVVSFIKVFKYGRYNQQLSQFVDTVTRAVMQMGSICVVIAVLMVAYSSAFMLAFGYELSDYRDFKTTMFTLFKAALGDFDLDKVITGTNVYLGPALMLSFIVVMFFVILSMFLAIVDDAFSSVREKVDATKAADAALDAADPSGAASAARLAAADPSAARFNADLAWCLALPRRAVDHLRGKKVAPGLGADDPSAPTDGDVDDDDPISRMRRKKSSRRGGGGGGDDDDELTDESIEIAACESEDNKVAYEALHARVLRVIKELDHRQDSLAARLNSIDQRLEADDSGTGGGGPAGGGAAMMMMGDA